MKSFISLFSVLLICQVAFCQGKLETIFYNLPAEYCMHMDLAQKKDEVAEMKANTTNQGSFLDERNGYLKRVGNQCAYELCYWKNYQPDSTGKSKQNLVAVIDGCQHKPIFLAEKAGAFTPVHFTVFDQFDARYFFKADVNPNTIQQYLNAFSFTLPHHGYAVTAHYGSAYGEKEASHLLQGDKIDFAWKNNEFEQGEPYF